jgi:hypothetical protein
MFLMETFLLEDKIKTNYSGYNQLCKFYHFCLGYPDGTRFHIDFKNVEWFDGNICALLWAMVYKLNKERGFLFTTDAQVIKEKFDVLYRNGFLKAEEEIIDLQKSTVPIQAFSIDDKDGYCKYVLNDLLGHRGMPDSLQDEIKNQIAEDLLEVFCNSHFHANTSEPFFVGGQYYPNQGLLKFTMVDLGDGFLPRIAKATNGKITTDLKSILWALEGNSTKLILDNCPGGLGLKNMYNYCQKNRGVLQIVSGTGYWGTDLENSIFQGGRLVPKPFVGTTINLFFRK